MFIYTRIPQKFGRSVNELDRDWITIFTGESQNEATRQISGNWQDLFENFSRTDFHSDYPVGLGFPQKASRDGDKDARGI